MGKYDFSKRQKSSMENSDRGPQKRGIFDFGENPVMYFTPLERNKIDILPFQISSKNNPAVAAGKYKIGEYDYVLNIYVHKYVGPMNEDFVCLKQNYGKPCPICEEGKRLYMSGDKEGGLKLNAKRRVFYNVIDRSGDNSAVQILDQSYEWFEKELVRSAASVEDEDGVKEGGFVDFASPDVGQRVLFRMEGTDLKTSNGKPVLKPARFTFKARENIEERMADSIPLDKYLIIPTYQELQAALDGNPDVEVSESGYISDTGTTTKVNAVKIEPTMKCPSGHTFGIDNDEYPECEDCTVWKQCAKAPKTY